MQRIKNLLLTIAVLGTLPSIYLVGMVSSAAIGGVDAEPEKRDGNVDLMAFLTGQTDLPRPSYCEPAADKSTVGYYGVVDRFTQDRIANRLHRERSERGWQPIFIDFKEPLATDRVYLRETGHYSITGKEKILRSLVIDGSYVSVPNIDHVLAKGDFANQAAAVLDGVLRKHPRLFASERQRHRATEGLQIAIENATASNKIDLSRSSETRLAAILTSLRDLGEHHLKLDRYNPAWSPDAALTDLHLRMHENLRSLYWRVLMAIERGDLTPADARSQSDQQRWILDFVRDLPKDPSNPHPEQFQNHRKRIVVESLRVELKDPLNPFYDRPMTGVQFAKFKETIGTQTKVDPAVGYSDSLFSDEDTSQEEPLRTLSDGTQVVVTPLSLGTVAFEIRSKAEAAFHSNDSVRKFNESGNLRFDADGKSVTQRYDPRFASSPKVSSSRHMKGFSDSLQVVDIRVFAHQFVRKPSFVRDQQAMLEWVRSSQKGDLIRRGSQIVALRSGRLLRLEASSWPAADAISETMLRQKIDAAGAETVDLGAEGTEWYAVSTGSKRDPIFLVLLSAEGDFWTVAIEGVNAAGDFRIRQRMHPVSYEAKTGPAVRADNTDNSGAMATVAGRVLDANGEPMKTRGQLYYDTRFHRGRLLGLADGCSSDRFWAQVPAGQVSLGYFCKGYEPTWLTFDIPPGDKLEDITFRLKPGWPGTVRVVDEEGKPIVGAVVIEQPQHGGVGVGPQSTLTTDSKGECFIHDAGGGGRNLTVIAAGYLQQTRYGTHYYSFQNRDAITVTMARPRRATGVVLGADGKPLDGAKLFMRRGCFDAPLGELVATTDADGRFRIDDLLPNAQPLVLAQAPDGAVGLYRGIQAEQEHEIVVPKRADLRVVIKGDLDLSDESQDASRFEVRQHIYSKPQDESDLGSFLGRDHGFILLDEPTIEPTPEGGVAILQGLAIECDPEAKQHKVDVFVKNSGRWGDSEQHIIRDGVTQVEITLPPESTEKE